MWIQTDQLSIGWTIDNTFSGLSASPRGPIIEPCRRITYLIKLKGLRVSLQASNIIMIDSGHFNK